MLFTTKSTTFIRLFYPYITVHHQQMTRSSDYYCP